MRVGWIAIGMAAACGGPTENRGPPTWSRDVAPIVERNCTGCHDETGGQSGIPLGSYADARPWADAMGVAVESRAMPPWLADPDCNEYRDDTSLSDADRQTVLDWVDAGAPEGDRVHAAPTVPPLEAPGLARVDRTLQMAGDYTPQLSPDDYRCFVMEWPDAGPTWVTGFDVVPGNRDIVHHVIAFLIDPADADQYRALDAADPTEGYTCFGGPGGDIDTLIRTKWLGGWAPGVGASVMPEGTGIEVAPGSLVVLQLHYNTAASPPAPDRSAMDLTVESEPQGWASLQPWTDVSWVVGVGMDIPAHTTGVEHDYTYTLEGDDRFTIRGAALHAHLLARSARIELRRADGTKTCLLDLPRYDFNWQRDYRLVDPVPAKSGDQIRLSCVWDNPTDGTVTWGEGTGSEMCVGLTLLTE